MAQYWPCFNATQMSLVPRARERAEALVTDYYRIAPREWQRMRYEVKTLRLLDSSEVTDRALAHTLCYSFRREAGPALLEEGDLYRICLQDHNILGAAQRAGLGLEPLLTYVLTHELVHVIRFGQRLQRLNLPLELRPQEEQRVEKTTQAILRKSNDADLKTVLSSEIAHVH
ncbi:MAG TPA: hypothetical protein VNO14_18295 [Blastocatellia bacterium]|nr:hypothetical protein [Blastocatellia bacterium]